MDRRQMCKLTLGVAGVAATGTYLSESLATLEKSGFHEVSGRWQVITPAQADILKVLVRSMLGPELVGEHTMQVVVGLDSAIAGLPLAIQSEVLRLLALLESRLFMALATGRFFWPARWQEIGEAELSEVLEGWRFSALTPLRMAYQALHELIMASFYGQELAWPQVGYGGPPF